MELDGVDDAAQPEVQREENFNFEEAADQTEDPADHQLCCRAAQALIAAAAHSSGSSTDTATAAAVA